MYRLYKSMFLLARNVIEVTIFLFKPFMILRKDQKLKFPVKIANF